MTTSSALSDRFSGPADAVESVKLENNSMHPVCVSFREKDFMIVTPIRYTSKIVRRIITDVFHTWIEA